MAQDHWWWRGRAKTTLESREKVELREKPLNLRDLVNMVIIHLYFSGGRGLIFLKGWAMGASSSMNILSYLGPVTDPIFLLCPTAPVLRNWESYQRAEVDKYGTPYVVSCV